MARIQQEKLVEQQVQSTARIQRSRIAKEVVQMPRVRIECKPRRVDAERHAQAEKMGLNVRFGDGDDDYFNQDAVRSPTRIAMYDNEDVEDPTNKRKVVHETEDHHISSTGIIEAPSVSPPLGTHKLILMKSNHVLRLSVEMVHQQYKPNPYTLQVWNIIRRSKRERRKLPVA